ncbi:heme-binding protein [Ensifer sp. MPMI2T]|nr:heme-binding protein [Ensifer sp. MPMI2T]
MEATENTQVLTDDAVLTMLSAARERAQQLHQPQCIVIVDASGVTLAQLRMRGARFLSLDSALSKARTAASIGAETKTIPEEVRLLIAAATGGAVTGLAGGVPIRIAGVLVGGIGVGSGTGEQDVGVARAALEAIGADLP